MTSAISSSGQEKQYDYHDAVHAPYIQQHCSLDASCLPRQARLPLVAEGAIALSPFTFGSFSSEAPNGIPGNVNTTHMNGEQASSRCGLWFRSALFLR